MFPIKLCERSLGAKTLIDGSANRFMDDYMTGVGKPQRVLDRPLYTILRDLENRSFWHVLEGIDANPEVRERAKGLFEESELTEMVSICLNQALVFPVSNAHPGSLRGNTTVYKFASNPESLTAQATAKIPQFLRGLQNGRFWEALSDMRAGGAMTDAYEVAKDVLLNHFSELDVSYLPKGMEIMGRQDAVYGTPQNLPAPYLRDLASKVVPKYGDFFLQLDANFSGHPSDLIQKEFRERFFKPYVERVLKIDQDGTPDFPVYKHPSVVSLLANEPSSQILDKVSHLKGKYDSIVRGD